MNARMNSTLLVTLLILPLATVHASETFRGTEPSAPQRQSEVAARRQAIADQLSELRVLQQHPSSEDAQQALQLGLRDLVKTYMAEIAALRQKKNGSKSLHMRDAALEAMTRKGVAFSTGGASWLLRGASFSPTNVIAFDRFLKKRGTDLIVVPVPSHALTYGHLLGEGIDPKSDYFPKYTESLTALLEADVEVVDLREAFRACSQPALTRQEQFWSPPGMEIAAEILDGRLQRYEFVREQADGKRDFTSTTGLELTYVKTGNMAARKPLKLDCKLFSYSGADQQRWDLIKAPGWHQVGQYDDRALANPVIYGPLTVLGDDNGGYLCNHHAGFPDHLSSRLGFVVCHASRSAGHGFREHLEYVDTLASIKDEPRVLVLVIASTRLRHFAYFDEGTIVTKRPSESKATGE